MYQEQCIITNKSSLLFKISRQNIDIFCIRLSRSLCKRLFGYHFILIRLLETLYNDKLSTFTKLKASCVFCFWLTIKHLLVYCQQCWLRSNSGHWKYSLNSEFLLHPTDCVYEKGIASWLLFIYLLWSNVFYRTWDSTIRGLNTCNMSVERSIVNIHLTTDKTSLCFSPVSVGGWVGGCAVGRRPARHGGITGLWFSLWRSCEDEDIIAAIRKQSSFFILVAKRQ